jgi:hypothetical protein
MNSATLFSDDLVQAVSVQEHHGGDREPVMRCGDVFLATAALGVCGVSSRLCSICDRAMSNPVRFRSGPTTVRHPMRCSQTLCPVPAEQTVRRGYLRRTT